MTPEQLTMMREDAAAARANATRARYIRDDSGLVGLSCDSAETLAAHVDRLCAEVERLADLYAAERRAGADERRADREADPCPGSRRW